MVGNCDKMLLISSTSNEWQQNNQVIDDQKTGCFTNNNNMGSVGAARVMDQKLPAGISHEQQQQIHKQQNQEPLKCPRCDSTNTKFCYYNNYSLSQPRHFCKACKRYWTRGGTLRNVPVGGGCRKNKRVRRPSSIGSCSSSSITNSSFSDHHAANDLISSASNHVNHHPSLFYGLPSSHHNLGLDSSFPFSRYDLPNPPPINGLGLGFQSSSCGFGEGLGGGGGSGGGGGGFHIPASKQIFQDLISSNPLLSNYATTTTTSTSSTPTISSLLANSLHLKASNNFQTMLPSYDQDNLQLKANGEVNPSGGMFMKEVKMELEAQNRSLDHHNQWSNSCQNEMDQPFCGSSSDPSLTWSSGGGNGNNLGAWIDPSNNLGSSSSYSVPVAKDQVQILDRIGVFILAASRDQTSTFFKDFFLFMIKGCMNDPFALRGTSDPTRLSSNKLTQICMVIIFIKYKGKDLVVEDEDTSSNFNGSS